MTGLKMKKKTKRTIFNARLDKVGFTEAQGLPWENPGLNGTKIRVLCDFNCPKGLENLAQGSNPEGKARRLTYDRWLTGVFDSPQLSQYVPPIRPK